MKLLDKIRLFIIFFIVALILCGVTAFPVKTELHWLLSHSSLIPSGMQSRLQSCDDALKETTAKYTMPDYGWVWLGFAHI